MQEPTRQRLIIEAHRQFAAQGFSGVSIAAIAGALGLTKQALLHHFGSKEALYGEVLSALSDRITRALRSEFRPGATPEARLRAALKALHGHLSDHRDDARLVLRELLDAPERAKDGRTWYLRPFLDEMTDLAAGLPRWQGRSRAEVFAGIYQVIGAVNYFAVSGPTLGGIYGPETLADVDRAFPAELDRMLAS